MSKEEYTKYSLNIYQLTIKIKQLNFLINLFIFAILDLHCCVWASSSCGEQGLLSSCGVQAFLVMEHRLSTVQVQ